MLRLMDLFVSPAAGPWLALADAILKATVLFAAAGLVSVLLRKATAAARHLVWSLALVSAMALPVLSLALPRWQVRVVTLTPPTASAAPEGSAAEVSATDIHEPAAPTRRLSAAPATPRASVTNGEAHSLTPTPSTGKFASVRSSLQNISWTSALLGIWAFGAALVLIRLLTGVLGVIWLSRRTERVSDSPWLPLARTLASELGLSPGLVFLRSGRATMPMAWGILRRAVLMPADADAWPAERLRIVLLHELAHVKRRDCLTHMLAQISCALYWFNPLAWMAARHLRMERERACDDLVLAAGTHGPDYADQLLEIARVMRSGRFPAVFAGASLAMAQRSQLEGRLMAILDPTVPRAGVSRLKALGTSTLFACALMPLASVQPWAYAAPAESQALTQPTVPQPVQPAAPVAPTSAPAATPAVPTPPAVSAAPVKVAQPSDLNEVLADVQNRLPEIVATAVDAAMPAAMPHLSGHGADDGIDLQDNDHTAKNKPADPRMVAALTAALKDTDKDVRETALQALVRLRDPGIFDPLVQALSDAAADVRQHAAFGLGQMRDKRAVEPLSRALKDANGDVREQAAFALGQIRDRSAVAALTSVLKDTDEDVRQQAVFALGQLRDPAAIDALAIATHDTKADVRQQAVFALGQIRDPRAVEPLISALKDANAEVREQAAFALGQIRDHGAVEALVIALKDSIADVRQQAVFALGQLRDPRAIDGLTAALKDTSAEVRQQAAFALGQLAR
jgi:HEAT repeat protein/beta-lactamase regulating signal transducer with metallopeptidase domain